MKIKVWFFAFLAALLVSPLTPHLSPRSFGASDGKGAPQPGPKADLRPLMAALGVQPIEAVAVPEFTLPDVDNKPFLMNENIGKVILLNFWATW